MLDGIYYFYLIIKNISSFYFFYMEYIYFYLIYDTSYLDFYEMCINLIRLNMLRTYKFPLKLYIFFKYSPR